MRTGSKTQRTDSGPGDGIRMKKTEEAEVKRDLMNDPEIHFAGEL